MRRQEYIYTQTGVCTRNRTKGVNTSSDFCQNDSTTYDMSGATKIIDDEKTCDFSGISYYDILTGATECFIEDQLSGGCFNATVWSTRVVADDVIVNDLQFFTGTGLTSDVPTGGQFITSVSDSLNTLGYSYVQSGTTFTIDKPFGVGDLRFDIHVTLDMEEDCIVTGSTCGCPAGYSGNTGGDACVSGDTIAATVNSGGTLTVIAGDQISDYGIDGATFYENVSSGFVYPIGDVGSTLVDATGTTVTKLESLVRNSLWGDSTTVKDGRLNAVGLWTPPSPNSEWVGFSYCLDLETSGNFVLGIGADDFCRFRINGELIVEFLGGTFTFKTWHMIPITLNSGKNIIEMEGYDSGGFGAFAAEIYDETSEVLSGMTTESELSAVTVFTTGDLLGEEYELGEDTGYSCPAGYALDTCLSGTPVCTSISYVPSDAPCEWTGTCEDVSYTACSNTFDTIKSGDTGVYIIDEEEDIPFLFNFTGDTSDVNSTTSFKFEVYKYDKLSSSFKTPAVFKSEEIPYSQISGATEDTLISDIPVDSLRMDGDYLIKGYFTYEACTEFASRLGIKIDTSNFKNGSEYNLYNSDDDWYFVAITKAEVPTLISTAEETNVLGSLRTYSLFPSITSGQTEYQIQSNYNGDIMVALNGLTLANNYDYTYSASTLTLTGATYSGDVITIVDTVGDGDVNDLKNDVILVDSPVVSGATDNEGNNSVYFNSDSGKYELFTSVIPANGSDLTVTINGITLANNIDYYQSITNPKRIILEGEIYENDIINIYYLPGTNVSGPVTTKVINIGFTIPNAPTEANGFFVVEVADSTDTDFTTIQFSGTTSYEPQVNSYVIDVEFDNVGFGDDFIYRVRNQKEYVSLSGDKIISIEYSEVVPIEIQTNNINSY